MESWVLPAVWAAACVVFIFLEAATTAMVSCWFAIGAGCALLGALFGLPLLWQIILFAAGSLVSFIAIHKKVFGLLRYEHTPDGASVNLGKQAVVTEAIEPGKDGRIRLGDGDWKATADVPIEAGETVKTVALSGVTMKVVRTTPRKDEKSL